MKPDMKNWKCRIIGAEKGMVVMLVLILIITLSLLAAAANRNVVTDISIASNHLARWRHSMRLMPEFSTASTSFGNSSSY